MAKKNKQKSRINRSAINLKGIAKFIIPLLIGVGTVASIYNIRTSNSHFSFYLEEDCYAVQSNESLNGLNAANYEATALVELTSGTAVYTDDSGKNITLGEEKTQINDSYPLFARSGEVLYFINDTNTLINSSFEELPTYEGLRLIDGTTYNANESRADFDDILFVKIGSLYQVSQEATVASNVANRTINGNTICEFKSDAINCFELFGDHIRSYRIPVYGDTKITVGNTRLSYASLLEKLGLVRSNDNQQEEEPEEAQPSYSGEEEEKESENTTSQQIDTDAALPTIKTDLPNTIQPLQPTAPDEAPADWQMCEVSVDPNATSWTYLISFNIKTKDEAAIIKSGIKFYAWEKTPATTIPSVTEATVAADSIPRYEGWYEKIENDYGVVRYEKTRDKVPVENKSYYACDNNDLPKIIWIKKLFYISDYVETPIEGPDFPSNTDIYEKIDDGAGNITYSITSDSQVQEGKTYYKHVYTHVISNDGDNPSANGWYEKNGNNFVLTSDTSVSSECYRTGKQKNRTTYINPLEETEGVVDIGQLEPNSEFLIGYTYDYTDKTNSIETVTEYVGIYSTSDYDQLSTVSLSFDGDDDPDLEVFQNKIQIRGLRFDNIFNGEEVIMGDLKVAQATSDNKKTETYITKFDIQYQEVQYDSNHSRLAPTEFWSKLSLESSAINVLKKGFKLIKWDSDTKLKYGKEYYYKVRLYDKFGHEFIYTGNMSENSLPAVFLGYTSKNIPSVSITIPSSSNKVGSVVVNTNIKNDAHVSISNFTDLIKGQDLTSYQAVMFFTSANDECIPENAIEVKGVRTNSDGTKTNFDSNGIYYLPISTMDIVPDELSGNPSTKGWYELSGSTYVFSSDTSKQAGKTYYFDDGVTSSYKITSLSSNTPYNVGVMLGSFDCNDNKEHKNELIQSTATFICGSLRNYGNIQYSGTATGVTHNDAKVNVRLVNNNNEQIYNTVLNSIIQYVEILVKNESNNSTTKLTIFKDKNGYNLNSNDPRFAFLYDSSKTSYEYLVPVYIDDNLEDVYFMTLRCELSNPNNNPKYKLKDMVTDEETEDNVSNIWNFLLSTSNTTDANYWSFNCVDFLKLEDGSSVSGYTTINTPAVSLAKNSDYRVTMNIYGTNDNISFENLVTSSSKAITFKTTKQEPTADFADIYIGDDYIEIYNLSFTDIDKAIEASTITSDPNNAYIQIKLGDQVINKYNVNTALDYTQIDESDMDMDTCPKDNLWFEKNGEEYVITQDLVVDNNKTYYKKYYSLIRISGLKKNTNYTLSIVAKNFNNGKDKAVDYPLILSALSSYNNQVKSYDFYTSSLITGEISLNSMYRLYFDGPTSESEQKKNLGLVSPSDWEYDSENKTYETKDYIPIDKNSYYSLRTGLESSRTYVSTVPTSLKEIEYVQVARANQYILTDYYANTDTVVELKGFSVLNSLFGNNPSDSTWFNLTVNGNVYRYRNGIDSYYDFGTVDPEPHTFELSSSRVVYDGTEIPTPVVTTTFSSTIASTIFARRTASGTMNDYAGVGSRIYYLRIIENDTIIHNFVPCQAIEAIPDHMTNTKLRVSAGTVGFFDTITELFYVNNSNGNFAAPPDEGSEEDSSNISLSIYQKMNDTTYNLLETYTGNLLLNGNLFKLDDIYTGENYFAKLTFSNLSDSYSISNVVFEKFSDEKVDSEHNLMNLIQGSKSFVDNTAYDKDGNKVNIEGYSITNDYIEVMPDSVYYIEGLSDYSTNYYNYNRTGSTISQATSDQTASSHYILFYNERTEYVGYVSTGAQGSLFKTPANAKYLKLYIRGKQTNVDYSTVTEEEGLPSGYQQVQYVQSTGSAYIDSGILGGKATRIIYEYSSSTNNQDLIGARTGRNNRHLILMRSGNSILFKYYNKESGSSVYVPSELERITVDLNGNVATAYGESGNKLTTITMAATDFSTQYTLHFPGYNNKGSHGNCNNVKVFSMKMYRPTTSLVRDYVPCYRKSDGVAGLYDLVTRTFFVSQGDPFIKGPEVGEGSDDQLRVGFTYEVDSQATKVRRSNVNYYVPFYPKADGVYSIYTTNLSTGDPYLLLYDDEHNLLAQDDDSAGNHNAKITYELSSKRKYYKPITFIETIPPVDNPRNNGWYEYNGGVYSLTNDTTPVASKTYYVEMYAEDTTTNPITDVLYEVVNDSFVLTQDAARQPGKEYYRLEYQAAELYVANPKELNWYDKQGNTYSLSNDTTLISGKRYYLPSTFELVPITGTENPKELDLYVKENGSYFKSFSEHIEQNVYYVGATHSNQFVSSEIKYDISVSDYQYSYNYDNVGIYLYQSANLDYFNIEVEAKINQEADKTVDKEYFKNVSDTIVPISEDDLIAMYDLGGTPASLGWYEKKYTLTSDTEADPSKIYYVEKCRYEVVTVNTGDNPASLGWYERNGTKYTLSTDAVASSTKTYFVKYTNNEFEAATSLLNPADNELYELSYVPTTDTAIVQTPFYYAQGGSAKIVLYKTKTEITKEDNLELFEDDKWVEYKTMYTYNDIVGASSIRLGEIDDDYIISSVIEANYGYKVVLSVNRQGKSGQTVLDYINVSAIQPTYIIKDIPTLKAVASNPTGYYICISDIKSVDFCVYDGVFTGIIDFQGHTIELTSDNYLFKQLSSEAIIKNANFVYDPLVNEPMEDKMLPAGYTQIESITATGTQFINTGYIHNTTTRYETEVKLNPVNASGVWGAICGARPGSGYANSAALFFNTGGYYSYNCSAGNIHLPAHSVSFGTWNKISFTQQKIVVDDQQYLINRNFSIGPCPAYLFALNAGGSLKHQGSLSMRYFKIYNGETLVKDFVPCISPSGDAGMYDKVSNTFYDNAGTGEFLVEVPYSEDGSTISGVTSNTSISYSNVDNVLGGDSASLVLNNYGTLNNIIMHYAPDTIVKEIYNEDIYYFEVKEGEITTQYRLVGKDTWYVLSAFGYELCHPDNALKNKMIQTSTGLNIYSYSNNVWRLESSTDDTIVTGEVELSPEKMSGLKLTSSEYTPKRTSPYTIGVNTAGLVFNNYGLIDGFAFNFENDVYVKDNVSGIALNNYGTIRNGYVSGSRINNNTYMGSNVNDTHYAGFIHRMNYFTGVVVNGSNFSYNVSENSTNGSYISYISSYNNVKSNIENVYVVNDLRFQSDDNTASEYGAWETNESTTDNTLPSQFIEIDCIRTQGNNYIDTNLTTNDNITKIIADFSMDTITQAGWSVFGAGIKNYQTTGLLLTIYPNNSQANYVYGGGYNSFSYTWQKDKQYTAEVEITDTNRILRINGATVVNGTKSNAVSAGLKYYIFANSETASVVRVSSGLVLYGFKMYQGENCVRDYVPCVAIENISSNSTGSGKSAPAGTLGLYDLVTKKFYFTSGSGQFSYPNSTKTIDDDSYQQVEYIESFAYGASSSSSGQVINTNVSLKANSTYTWDIDFALTKFNGNESDVMSIKSGSYNFTVGCNSSNAWLSSGHESGTSYYSTSSASAGTVVKSKGSTKPSFNINEKLFLFAQNDGGSATNKSSLKLFAAKIYEDNVLIRDYVPCFRKYDNKPGLYDLVNETFVTNSGQGEFYFDYAKVPSEYQRVEYITSNGNQIIKTGYIHNINTKYEAIISGAPPSSGYTGLFGAQNKANSYSGSLSLFSQSGNKLFYRNTSSGTSYNTDGYSFGSSYMHIIASTSMLQLNSKVLTTFSLSSYGPNTLECYLFGVNNSNSIDSTKRTTSLRRFKIFDNDVLVHDYVPCYEKATNVIGVYDLVDNEFKANGGSGTFTKGKDLNLDNVSIENRDFSLFSTDYSSLICGYNEGTIKNSYSVGDLYDFEATTGSSIIQYSDFEILQYVESNGNQYVSLGFAPASNSRIELDYQFLNDLKESQVGCGTANDNRRAMIQILPGNSKFIYGVGKNVTTSANKDFNRHIFTIDIANKKALLDGVVVGTSTATSISPDKNFAIFTRDHGTPTTYRHGARFYGLKYYEGSALKREFVPARRLSDGAIGILNTMTMVFHLPTGSELISGGSVGSAEGVSTNLSHNFNGQTVMFRSGPAVGATVDLGKNSNIRYASLDTDGLSYYNKKSWGSSAKSYMHNDNVGTTALSLSNTQWQEKILGQDGTNFIIKDYLAISKFPTIAWPSNFPSSTIPLIDIPSITSGIRVLSSAIKMKGVDANSNQAALITVDFYNPQKINVNSISIVDSSEDGSRELSAKVIGCNQVEGAIYRLDVLITYAGRDVVATTDADVVSVDNKKIAFADGTVYNLISQKPLVHVDDFGLNGQVIAISAKAQEEYNIVSINGTNVGSSGENVIRLDFYNSIGSISDWKNNFVNTYSIIEGNYRLISDLNFSGSTPNEWHITQPFNGILNGAIYQTEASPVVDSLGNTYIDDNGSPVVIYNEGEIIGLRTITGVGNTNEQGEYSAGKGYTSSTEGLSYESPSSSNFSLFYRLNGTIENLIFDKFVTVYNKQNPNSLYDVTVPICGVIQIAENGSTIDNCHVRNSAFNSRGIGGSLVGYASGTNIINSSVKNSTISSNLLVSSLDSSMLGGLVGYSNNSLVSNSYVSGVSVDSSSVTNIVGTGGLIGVADYTTAHACYVAGGGIISNGDFTGGLIGKVGKDANPTSNEFDYKTDIENCWTSVSVQTNNGDFVGGLVGYMGIYNGSSLRDSANKLINCYTSSTVLSLSYESLNVNRITSFDYDNQGYYSNNFAFVSQSMNYKSDSSSDVSAYQFGPSEELRGAARLLKSEEIRNPRTWIDEMKFNTSYYELSLPSGQELLYMPKLLNSNTGEVLYGQSDEQLGIDEYAELTVVNTINNQSGKYLSVTFDLRNSGWDQAELFNYNNDLSQNKWNDLAIWSNMYCSGGKVDYREDGIIPGIYIKPIGVRYEGDDAVLRFVTDIYYDDPENGHYANSYLLSIPIYLNSPITSPRINQNTYALVIVDENNRVRKDIFNAYEWNEFFADDGPHYNTEESIRLTGNLYKFDSYSYADGTPSGGSGKPAYNVKLSDIVISENAHPVFTGLVEYNNMNDVSFISSLSGDVSGITFEDFTIDYGNSTCSSYAGIIGQIDGEFSNVKFDNVSIKNIDSDNVGLIGLASRGSSIKNVSLNNVDVSVVGNHSNIGSLVGLVSGNSNVRVSIKDVSANSINVNATGDSSKNIGGLFGNVSYADIQNINIDANRKDAENPDLFEDLDYIEASGKQYIDLGINSIGNWRIDTRVTMTDEVTSKNYIAGNGNNISLYTGIDGYLYASINNSDSVASSYNKNTNRNIDLSWSEVDSIKINNEDCLLSGPSVVKSGSLSSNLCLFSNGSNQTTYGSLRMYYFTIYDGDTAIHHLIPRKALHDNTTAYRGTSVVTVKANTVGMYDTLTNKFYVSSTNNDLTNEEIIPSIYSRTDYIQSDYKKKQYIKTGVSLNNGYRIVGQGREFTSKSSDDYRAMLGAGKINTPNTSVFVVWNAKSTTGTIQTTTTGASLTSIPTNTILHFDMAAGSSGSYIKCNGYTAPVKTGDYPITSSELMIFATNTAEGSSVVANQFSTSRIYSLQIYHNDNETLRRNFIPVFANEDIAAYLTNTGTAVSKGTAGLYDTVTGLFYVNSGDDHSNFVYSTMTNDLPSDLQQVEYIQSTGGAYLDTGLRADSNSTIDIDFNINKELYYKDDEDDKSVYLFGNTGYAVKAYGKSIAVSSNIMEISTSKLTTNGLPDEYTEIPYIQNTENQWFDTGVPGNTVNGIDVGFTFDDCTATYPSLVSATLDDLTIGAHSKTGYYVRLNGPVIRNVTSGLSTEKMNRIKVYGGRIYLNDSQVATYSGVFSNRTENVYLGNNSDLSRGTRARIYYLKLWVNGALVRDYIPCYRNSDLEAGMYDKVNNKFYPSDTPVSFIKGSLSVSNNTTNSFNYSIRHQLMMNLGSKQAIIDDEAYNIASADYYPNVSTSGDVMLFRVNDGANAYYSNMTLYHYAQYDGNTLIRNLIPAFTKSTINYATKNGITSESVPKGTVGLYDTVSGKFFINSGSGEFICENNYANLPSNYEMLKYVFSNGGQSIDTGIRDKQGYTYEIKYNLSPQGKAGIFGGNGRGIITNESGNSTLYIDGLNSNKVVGYTSVTAANRLKDSMLINLDIASSTSLVNSHSYDDDNTGDTMAVFGVAGSSLPNGIGSVYYLKAWDERGILLADFVPCLDGSGQAGLYDLVHKEFKGSVFAGESLPVEEYNKYVYEEEFDYDYNNVISGSLGPTGGMAALISNTNIKNISVNRINVLAKSGYTAGVIGQADVSNTASQITNLSNMYVSGGIQVAGFTTGGAKSKLDFSESYTTEENTSKIIKGTKLSNIKVLGESGAGFSCILPTSMTFQNFVMENENIYSGRFDCGGFSAGCSDPADPSIYSDFIVNNINLYNNIYSSDSRYCAGISGYVNNNVAASNIVADQVKIRALGYGNGGLFGNTRTFSLVDSYTTNIDIYTTNNYSGGVVGQYATNFSNINSPVNNIYLYGASNNGGLYGRYASGNGTDTITDSPINNINLNITGSWGGGVGGQSQIVNQTRSPLDRITLNLIQNGCGAITGWSNNSINVVDSPINNSSIYGAGIVGGAFGQYSGTSGSHTFNGNGTDLTNMEVFACRDSSCGGVMGGATGNYVAVDNFNFKNGFILSPAGYAGGVAGIGWNAKNNTVGQAEHITSSIPGVESKDTADVFIWGKRYVSGLVSYQAKLANVQGRIESNNVYNTYIYCYTTPGTSSYVGGAVGYNNNTPGRVNTNNIENCSIINNSTAPGSITAGILSSDPNDSISESFNGNVVKNTLIIGNSSSVGGIAGKVKRTDNLVNNVVKNSVIIGKEAVAGIVVDRVLGNVSECGIEDTIVLSTTGPVVGGIIATTNISTFNDSKFVTLSKDYVRSSGVNKGYTLQTIINKLKLDEQYLNPSFVDDVQNVYNTNKSLVTDFDKYNTVVVSNAVKSADNNNSIGGIAGIYKGKGIDSCYVGKDVLIGSNAPGDSQAYVGGLVGILDNSTLVKLNNDTNIASSKIQTVNNSICQATMYYGGNDSLESAMGGLFGLYRHTTFTTKFENEKYYQSWDYDKVIGIDPTNVNNILYTGNVCHSSLNSQKVNPVVGREIKTEFNNTVINNLAGSEWLYDSSGSTIVTYHYTGTSPSYTPIVSNYYGNGIIDFTKKNTDLYYFDGYDSTNPAANNWYELSGTGSYVHTADLFPIIDKEYYVDGGGNFIAYTFSNPYGKSKISNRAEGVGRFRTNSTLIPNLYDGVSQDTITSHTEALRVSDAQIGDGTDTANTFLYAGDISYGNMKLDTWFAGVWDGPKAPAMALSARRPLTTLNKSNEYDVTRLINELQVYSSGIDRFNIEFKHIPENELKYTISSLSDSVSSVWPENARTISFAYDYSSDIQITLEYNGQTADKTISSGDLCRTISTYDDSYWYLYENKVMDKNNNSINNTRSFIHLYDCYALDNSGNVFDLSDGDNLIKSINGLASIDQVKPLWEGYVITDEEEHLIRTFRTYTTSDDLIIDNAQMYVIDSELLSFSIDKTIVSGPIFMMYGSKKYGSVLSSTGSLIDYGEELTYPDGFVNDDIKEISDNVDYNDRIALVRYNSGKLIAFDILTGNTINVLSDEKVMQSLFSFIGSNLKSLLSPSYSGSSKGALSTVNSYEDQVDSSATLKHALDELDNEITSTGGSTTLEEDDIVQEEQSQPIEENTQEEIIVSEENNLETQEILPEGDIKNGVKTYAVNNKYISIYNEETKEHDIYKASQLLNSEKDNILSEEQKAKKLEEKGFKVPLNAKENNKAEEANGLIIMIMIAMSIIALVAILLFTKLNTIFKDE